jgi:FkbM family methyltransferase
MVQMKQISTPPPAPLAYRTADAFPWRIRLLRRLGRLVWLPRGQDALLRAVYDPDAGMPFAFEIDFFGLRYRGDLGEYLDWQVFCYGGAPLCELHLLRDLVAQLRAGSPRRISFYDIGANIGHHSLFMSPLVDDVYAFEPLRDLTHQIAQKITLNGLTNVHIVPFALGEDDTSLAYYPGAGSNSGVGSLIAGFPGVCSDSVTVEVRNGGRLLAAEGLPKIDIMKLDVQGFEANVLKGLGARLRSDRPIVLAELSDHSRSGFGSAAEFRALFCEGTTFAEVIGRNGRTYALKPFNYETAEEVLVLPPEFSDFLRGKI